MAKSLILVQDSAGEPVLINIGNIVRVSEHEERRLIEILTLEPCSTGADAIGVVYEMNKYYSEVSLTEFMAVYA